MSCQPCNDRQESGQKIYYRWGNANVEINACDNHFMEIRKVLNQHQLIFENEKIVPCMGCKRTLPNGLINALVTNEGVEDLCAICGLERRNEALGVPKDTPFTGSMAQDFYDRTVVYYNETNQS